MIGGRVGLRIDPDLLGFLGEGRTTVLVTGTNGKSTTSRLLVAALSSQGQVASNGRANRTAGLVSALAAAPANSIAVLETRESEFASVVAALRPAAVVLVNLSNDVDKDTDPGDLERELREVLSAYPEISLIANCDDVRTASIAFDAPKVVWVACGPGSQGVVRGCPRCGSLITMTTPPAGPGACAWRCSSCALSRPEPQWWVTQTPSGNYLHGPHRFVAPLDLALPGAVNVGNAALAMAAAAVMGARVGEALPAMSSVRDVGERYGVIRYGASAIRFLLAKNPAAAQESVGMIDPSATGAVFVLDEENDNSRDRAWIWDVDYSALAFAGAQVVASGARCAEMSLRLTYDGVPHYVIPDVTEAVRACPPGHVDVTVAGVEILHELEARFMPGRRGSAAEHPDRAVHSSRDVRGVLEPAGHVMMHGDDPIRIGLVLPEMQLSSGDRGNAQVLCERLRLRGYSAEVVPVTFDDRAPGGVGLYVFGGNESEMQHLAVRHLCGDSTLLRAIQNGVPVFAAGAGAQILGHWFEDRDSVQIPGLGLLDLTTVRVLGSDPSSVETGQEVSYEPLLAGLSGPLRGVAGGQSRFVLGPEAEPLAARSRTVDGGFLDFEGAVSSSIIATSLKGPLLAWNPQLADLLIARILGVDSASLMPLDVHSVRSGGGVLRG